MELIVGFVILLFLLLIGVPVHWSFGGVVIWLAISLNYNPFILFTSGQANISAVVLIAIPMFILAGGVMKKGNIGNALVDFGGILLGRTRSGMAIITVFVTAIFSSICGSGAATLATIGSVVAPRMKECKYPMGIAAAIACCAAPLSFLIPPTGIQILYAWLSNLSVLACFLSTVVPGIILMVLLIIVSWVMLKKHDQIIPLSNLFDGVKVSRSGNVKKTLHTIPALLMSVIILGGIYGGLLTPTEAAAVSVLYAIPVALFFYKGFQFRELKGIFVETSVTTGVIMIMIAFVMMMSRILTMENLPDQLTKLLMSITENPILLLLLINLTMIILGMIMDDTSALVLCAPILLPIAINIGVNPYHFAAILGVNLGMGNVTPPTAPFIFLAARIFNVDTTEVIKPVMIFLIFAYLPTLILTTFFPDLALALPRFVLGDKMVI